MVFDCWLSLRELPGFRLVDTVGPPMRLPSPLAPSVSPLTLPTEVPDDLSPIVGCKYLHSEDSHASLLSTSTSWHQDLVLDLVSVHGMDPKMRQSLGGLFFTLSSNICPCISIYVLLGLGYFTQDISSSINFACKINDGLVFKS